MRLLSLLRPQLVVRFFTSLREEGPRAAVSKAVTYVSLVRNGGGRSALPDAEPPQASQQQQAPHQYLSAFWTDIASRDAFHIQTSPAVLSKRRSIAVIGDLNLPQCRKYRVEQPAELWGALDVYYDYSSLQDLPRAIRIMQDATHLFIYRAQNTPLLTMYLYEARRLKLPVLYDIDDPLFSVSAYETYANMKMLPKDVHNHFIASAPLYLDAMNMADVITVSTPTMARHTRHYTSRSVHVRRNFADTATLTAASEVLAKTQSSGSGFCAVFASGSDGHEADFNLIRDDIIAFLKKDKSRRLLILGRFNQAAVPKGYETQIAIKPFTTYDRYLAYLAHADCGLMPLTNDLFNQCKSGVRVLDCAAVGVPSIVSNVGDLPNLIEHRKTGMVIDGRSSWLETLEALAKDRKTCAEIGKAARADMASHWAGTPKPNVIDKEIINWVCS